MCHSLTLRTWCRLQGQNGTILHPSPPFHSITREEETLITVTGPPSDSWSTASAAECGRGGGGGGVGVWRGGSGGKVWAGGGEGLGGTAHLTETILYT